MRRFLITSDKFTGHVELLYKQLDENFHLLSKIDFTNSGCGGNQVLKIKELTPMTASGIAEAFTSLPVIIVEADFEVTFDMFWNDYNHKVNRKRCLALWEKLSKTQQVKAWAGVKAYDKYLNNVKWGRAKADPDTYLRQEYWENEWK